MPLNPPQVTINMLIEVFDDLHDLLTTEKFAKVAVRSRGRSFAMDQHTGMCMSPISERRS